jgi:tetratricopeptide (TPR) repeat protein
MFGELNKIAVINLLMAAIIFILIPILISLISLLNTVVCPLGDGVLFYLVITLPAPIIGIGLSLFSLSIWRRFSYIIFILLIIIVAIVPLFELYFNPQIYFYNPLIGFFPGTIYDEGIEIDMKFIAYRVMNVLFFLSLIYFLYNALKEKSKNKIKLTWAYAILISVLFIFISPKIGYSTTLSTIKKELEKTITTRHFELHFPSSVDDTLVNVIALHHELYFAQLEKYFGATPTEKISSIIFSNREQKRKLFGSANADVAKPWIPQIYISVGNYDKTLKHEIAHCFTREFASGIFKVADNFNPVLIEGIASAADPEYDEYDLDYIAALAFHNDYSVELKTLFQSFNFFMQPSSLGYILSGSFIKYLNDKYGIEKFKKLYSDLDFPKYYQKDLTELEHEYEQFLKTSFASEVGSVNKAKYYFDRKTIFSKVCPRYVTKQTKKGWLLFNQKKYEGAKTIFTELAKMSDNYSSLIGLASCYEELNKIPKAITLLKENRDKYLNSGSWYELQFMLADLLARNGELTQADSIYRILVEQNPNRTLYSISRFRTDMLKTGENLSNYLSSDENEKYNIVKQMNDESYNYNSLPFFVSLAKICEVPYEEFLSSFSKVIKVNDYESAYGIYKLSLYLCEKMDFERARKMAALALRYEEDISLNYILKNNFEKMDWLHKNKDQILSTISYAQN